MPENQFYQHPEAADCCVRAVEQRRKNMAEYLRVTQTEEVVRPQDGAPRRPNWHVIGAFYASLT